MSRVIVHVGTADTSSKPDALVLKLKPLNDAAWAGRHRFIHHPPTKFNAIPPGVTTHVIGSIYTALQIRDALMVLASVKPMSHGHIEVSWHLSDANGQLGGALPLDIYEMTETVRHGFSMTVRFDPNDAIHERSVEYVA